MRPCWPPCTTDRFGPSGPEQGPAAMPALFYCPSGHCPGRNKNAFDNRTYFDLRRQMSSRPVGAGLWFRGSFQMSTMPQNVSPSGRREVMGGLAKGLEVLRTFSRAKPHMTLSEIAARAGLPAATARRCLNTLEELGYVARNGRQFLLRPQVLEIGAVY